MTFDFHALTFILSLTYFHFHVFGHFHLTKLCRTSPNLSLSLSQVVLMAWKKMTEIGRSDQKLSFLAIFTFTFILSYLHFHTFSYILSLSPSYFHCHTFIHSPSYFHFNLSTFLLSLSYIYFHTFTFILS